MTFEGIFRRQLSDAGSEIAGQNKRRTGRAISWVISSSSAAPHRGQHRGASMRREVEVSIGRIYSRQRNVDEGKATRNGFAPPVSIHLLQLSGAEKCSSSMHACKEVVTRITTSIEPDRPDKAPSSHKRKQSAFSIHSDHGYAIPGKAR